MEVSGYRQKFEKGEEKRVKLWKKDKGKKKRKFYINELNKCIGGGGLKESLKKISHVAWVRINDHFVGGGGGDVDVVRSIPICTDP
jgi:hypothetical protein